MPQTSSGETVYADPAERERYVQVAAGDLGLSTQDPDGDGETEWSKLLDSLQTKAKTRIDRFCQRDFADHPNDTVTLDGGTGTSVVRLPSPVRSVDAVRDGGETVPAKDYQWAEHGSLIRQKGQWRPGYATIEVDLDHGYRTPPEDVAEAELKLVDHTLAGMSQKREGTVVQSDDFSLEVNLPLAMNAEIKGMLRPHKRTEVFV